MNNNNKECDKKYGLFTFEYVAKLTRTTAMKNVQDKWKCDASY